MMALRRPLAASCGTLCRRPSAAASLLERRGPPTSTRSFGAATTLHERRPDPDTPSQNLMTSPSWTKQEMDNVEVTHRPPRDWVDRLSLLTVKTLRLGFDVLSGYIFKKRMGTMSERDWIRRIMFLETVAGVPGMVGGMVRHLESLRRMKRDYGWIHALLAEAENERMHLLIALKLRNPGLGFRAMVLGGQAFFLTYYAIAYLICPRYCHRFVGYLEEEAVITYSSLIQDIDDGKLPMFANMKAPKFAIRYYNISKDAMIRDVFNCIRMDESSHRDTNHHFGDLKPTDPNMMTDHLVKHHFAAFHILQGVDAAAWKITEKALAKEFEELAASAGGGVVPHQSLRASPSLASCFAPEDFDSVWSEFDVGGKGHVTRDEFMRMMHRVVGFDSKNFH